MLEILPAFQFSFFFFTVPFFFPLFFFSGLLQAIFCLKNVRKPLRGSTHTKSGNRNRGRRSYVAKLSQRRPLGDQKQRILSRKTIRSAKKRQREMKNIKTNCINWFGPVSMQLSGHKQEKMSGFPCDRKRT